MQCPQCQSSIESSASGDQPTACAACGTTLTSESTTAVAPETAPSVASATKAARPRGNFRISLAGILLATLLIALATVSVASTLVALRAADERTRAHNDYLAAAQAIDQSAAAMALSNDLKGTKMEPVRSALLQPTLDYYQKVVQTHPADKDTMPLLADAQFHIAGLMAKMGNKGRVEAMGKGLSFLNQMEKNQADPASYPSIQACALKFTQPTDWVKGGDVGSLVITVQVAIQTFDKLSKKYPERVSFRDDWAGVLKAIATLQSLDPSRSKGALEAWIQARDILETMVRDQPANTEYKLRFVESLLGAARIQKTAKAIDAATANYQRAIEVREQLVAANPEDKTLQQELTVIQREFQRMKPAQAAPAAPATATAQ